MVSISVLWISWVQMYPLPAGVSEIRSAYLCMCLWHSSQRSLDTTIICAESVPLWQAWLIFSITIMVTPGEGLQMKVPSLNLGIYTPYILSSPPSWSCPLTNHHSISIVSTDLPRLESHYYIRLPNGSYLFNSDSLRWRNDRMDLPFITHSCKLPLESPSVPWPIIHVLATWINLTGHLYLMHNQWILTTNS